MTYNTNSEQLKELFAEAGTVLAVDVIKDRDTGTSKGFAFITMANQADAAKAITMFNGKEVGGRPLKVNTAKAREERPGGGGGGGRSFNRSNDRNRSSGGGGGKNSRY